MTLFACQMNSKDIIYVLCFDVTMPNNKQVMLSSILIRSVAQLCGAMPPMIAFIKIRSPDLQ
jgi:hypothetical protein